MDDPSRGERGIALVIVLIVLMFTSILALEIKSSAALHERLATNQRDDFLMREAMRGQLEILKQVIHYDLTENKIDTLTDRWTEDKYTQFQEGPVADDDERDPEEPASSLDVELEARVEDEARKFNLFNLGIEDEAIRLHWEKVFIRLLVLFREEHPQHSLSETEAEDLLKNLQEWMKRRGDERGIPAPAVLDEKRILVTPDELLMVAGFTRELFYDQSPEDEDDDEVPGLCRHLTLWSAGRINLNTADAPVIRALFDPRDDDLAERLLEWREQEAEEQPEEIDPEADPAMNSFESLEDLKKIDGFDDAALTRNRLNADTLTVLSTVFSVHLVAESGDGLRRQERYVLERNARGFRTLMAEERNDPVPQGEEEEE